MVSSLITIRVQILDMRDPLGPLVLKGLPGMDIARMKPSLHRIDFRCAGIICQ